MICVCVLFVVFCLFCLLICSRHWLYKNQGVEEREGERERKRERERERERERDSIAFEKNRKH